MRTGGGGGGGGGGGSKRCGRCKGVCVPSLGRCDCGPYSWGADCSIPVVSQTICVHNDSSPWFCDKPACIKAAIESYSAAPGSPPRRCVGAPLSQCPKGCHGRGACIGGGRCACYEGYSGTECESPTPSTTVCMANCSGRGECHKGWCKCRWPFWGTDCARGPGGGVACAQRPCVYVYDLPPRMNVLALKTEYDWRMQYPNRKFDYRTPLVLHEALLTSKHRTTNAADADLFFVPVWDFHGSWGNPEVYYRAHRYISTALPYWNASGGADHLWAIGRDAAACDTPWGSLLEELRTSIILSNWGGVTGLSGRIQERCFAPGVDVVVPGTLTDRVVGLSPFWLGEAALEAQLSSRTTQLFFSGALCWKTSVIAHTDAQLKSKCDRSYSEPGFLSRYSFGLRYEIFRRHHNAKGFRLLASDYPPSLKQHQAADGQSLTLDEEIKRAKFCLCPSGTGWGMRVYHVLVLGCVPVLPQHDGEHPPVAQAFEPDILDWERFAVVVRRDQIAHLPQLLERVDLRAKQAALRQVWHRLVWRGALRGRRRDQLPSPDAFDLTIAAIAQRVKQGRVGQKGLLAGKV
jgi:hypothetical protein